jgi:hypothetical protein
MANTQMQAGVTYPAMSSMTGASQRGSAINSQADANAKLSSLNKIAGGGVVVPQVSGSYTQQNGSQGPSAQMTSLTATGGQQYQNSVYDAGALKKGGKSKTFGKNKTFGKSFGNRMDNRMNNKRFDKRMDKNKAFGKTKKRIHKKRIHKKRNRTKL